MAGSILIEVLEKILVSFIWSVMEHCNPEEPAFTIESFGFNPLENTGRECYHPPVGELIYKEYGNEESRSTYYIAGRAITVRLINACSLEELEELQGDFSEDRAMAWKRVRPSFLRTVCKSMYIGASISLFTATIVSAVYIVFSYLSYKTISACAFVPVRLVPMNVKWITTVYDVILSNVFYFWMFWNMLFLFRRQGLRMNLFLVSCIMYLFHVLYCIALQAVGKPYEESFLLFIPLYVFFAIGPCLQFSYIAWNLRRGSRKQIAILVFKLKPPGCLSCSLAFVVIFFIYPAYNRQKESHGKLLIAIFAPLIGVIAKVISRVSVQQLWNITHPGYSYVLLVPTYFGAAVFTRGLQAELDTLVYIATLGVIHGFAEVVERSTMMVVDHFCYRLWKRTSASWGSFQTSRRERLMADTAIMSMMFESAAIISVNGLLLFYQFIYLQSDSFKGKHSREISNW